MPVYLTPPPRSPLARALAAVVGALVLVGAFMVGMVAFVILLGVGLVGGAWVWFRTRHLRRAINEAAQAQATNGSVGSGEADGDTIDAEYVVIERREGDRDPTTDRR